MFLYWDQCLYFYVPPTADMSQYAWKDSFDPTGRIQ